MRASAALVLLLLAGAGCLGSGGSGDGGAGGGAQSSTTSTSQSSSSTTGTGAPSGPPIVDLLLAFALAPCEGLTVVVPQPLADVQELLPDGFTAAATALVPGGNMGAVAVDLFACGNLTTPLAAVPNTYYGQVYAFIKPPSARVPEAPSADVHEYVFRLLAGPDILAILWPRAGYDTYNGTVNASVGAPAPAPVDLGLRVGQADVREYMLAGDGRPAASGTLPGDQSFARYTLLSDGSVLLWNGTYEQGSTAEGEGLLRVPAGDVLARFETPAGSLHGFARLHESFAMTHMDLRRIFYPA